MKSHESKMDLQSDASQVAGLAASSDAARTAILMRIRQAQGRGKRVVAGELAQRDLLFVAIRAARCRRWLSISRD